MINTQSFKLDIKKATIQRLRVVNGDTANVFVITIQDDGNAVALDATLHKVIAVFTRSDGQVYTQDADTGLSFTTGGVVTIELHPSSFRTGTNRVCLQVYKRENSSATVYPLLCTTNEAQFPARAQAIPDAGAENAPSQLPMLEQIIVDARTAVAAAEEAVDACEDATEAANQAERDAGHAAQEATIAATAANTAAQGANAAAFAANNAASTATSAALVADGAAQNADAKAAEAEAAAAAATAAAAKQTFYIVPLTNDQIPNPYQGVSTTANMSASDLLAIMQSSLLCVTVTFDGGQIALYERYRDTDGIYLRSHEDIGGYVYTANIETPVSGTSTTVTIGRTLDKTPRNANISNGVITFVNWIDSDLFSVSLPIFDGSVI